MPLLSQRFKIPAACLPADCVIFSADLGAARGGKEYFDPIHGAIELDPLAVRCMDTPVFQRLRELKQLGSSYFVFGGASHNRFEHSVGVYHLSKTMIDRFASYQPELGITDDERTAVALAGLLHDLGHGPFSHVFDAEFIPRARPGATWTHEQMSIDLIDVMLEQGDLHEDLSPEVVSMIKGMIMGGKPPKGHGAEAPQKSPEGSSSAGQGPPSMFRSDTSSSRPASSSSSSSPAASAYPASNGVGYSLAAPGREFLYEIVANARNNIDVDKFDYLARDSRCVGLKSTFDFSRLVRSARVVEGQICFPFKEAMTIYNLFFNRYLLFKQIYTHRASKAIEFMLTDVLLEADRAWKGRISRAIDDPRYYAKLTDGILRDIENSSDPSLAKARSIVSQLRRRKLYRFVDQWLVPKESTRDVGKPSAEEIAELNPRPEVQLQPEDLVVQDFKLHFGNKDKDPLQLTGFFRPSRPDVLCAHDPSKFSHCITPTFQERILRLYCRRPEREYVRAAGEAFRRWVKRVSPGASNTPDHSSRIFSPPRSVGGRSRDGGGSVRGEGGGRDGDDGDSEDEEGMGRAGLGIGSRTGERRMTLSQQNILFGEGDLAMDEAAASQLQPGPAASSSASSASAAAAESSSASAGPGSGDIGVSRASGGGLPLGSKRDRATANGGEGEGEGVDDDDEDEEDDDIKFSYGSGSKQKRGGSAPLSQIPDAMDGLGTSGLRRSGSTGSRPPSGASNGAASKRRRTSAGSATAANKGKGGKAAAGKPASATVSYVGLNPWTMSASYSSSGSKGKD